MRSWTPSPSVSLVNAGWHRDSQNRLVLLRVPPQVGSNSDPGLSHLALSLSCRSNYSFR